MYPSEKKERTKNWIKTFDSYTATPPIYLRGGFWFWELCSQQTASSMEEQMINKLTAVVPFVPKYMVDRRHRRSNCGDWR
jgi:hypothetical protein